MNFVLEERICFALQLYLNYLLLSFILTLFFFFKSQGHLLHQWPVNVKSLEYWMESRKLFTCIGLIFCFNSLWPNIISRLPNHFFNDSIIVPPIPGIEDSLDWRKKMNYKILASYLWISTCGTVQELHYFPMLSIYLSIYLFFMWLSSGIQEVVIDSLSPKFLVN